MSKGEEPMQVEEIKQRIPKDYVFSCRLVIRAYDRKDVEQYIKEQGDFIERRLFLKGTPSEAPDIDLTLKGGIK